MVKRLLIGMARRVLRNRATEETQKALKKGLGGRLKGP